MMKKLKDYDHPKYIRNSTEVTFNGKYYYIIGKKLNLYAQDIEAELCWFIRYINGKIVFFVELKYERLVTGLRRQILLSFFRTKKNKPLGMRTNKNLNAFNICAEEVGDLNRFKCKEVIRFDCKYKKCNALRYVTVFEGALRYSNLMGRHFHERNKKTAPSKHAIN